MDPAAAKQQIAERVKQASKFLVTVNNNPSVDQLAACIGLTLLLNKMGKHATAVFSGRVPNTLEFLKPEQTIQPTTDSLRDFIISLDKNKADKLRYKVEQDVVRIFITPYKTSLSEKDLIFSEGDFNVEVVVALGIKQRTQIDQAIMAHGRILHDATVISINNGPGKAPDIGQVNWQDPAASSLSEMLVSISESFGPGLIDAQMATAFLTGIVAETQRFSNTKTSPKVMTMSAQLMAAGANQQLIVSKLEPPPPPPPKAPPPPPPAPHLPPPQPPKEPPKPPKEPPKEPPAEPPKKPVPPKEPPKPPLKPEGVLNLHDGSQGGEMEVSPTEIHIDEEGNIISDKEMKKSLAAESAAAPAAAPPLAAPQLADVPVEPPPAPAPLPEPPAPVPEPAEVPPFVAEPPVAPPVMPQVTPDEPELTLPPEPELPHPHIRDVRAEPASSPTRSPLIGNRHAYLGASTAPEWASPYDLVPSDPATNFGTPNEDAPSGAARPLMPDSQADSVDELGVSQNGGSPLDSARSAVEGAYSASPFDQSTGQPTQTPMAASDTPMLVLPGNEQGAVAAQPPSPVDPAAPPPLPPPLNVAPGAVVPNYPPPQ